MKRVDWILGLAVAGLVGCSQPSGEALNGYVEAEPVRVSSPVGGRLVSLTVDRGSVVTVGQALFALEQDNEKAALDEARARVAQAQASAIDLSKGKRPDELAVNQASLKVAEASLKQSESDLARQTALAESGFASPSSIDAFKAKRDVDAAQVAQMRAQVRVAQLAARDDARTAAQADTDAARAQLAQRQWVVTQKSVTAPVAARVEDRYYRVGEWVPAGSPVLSLQEPAAVKVRFFVPEPQMPHAGMGAHVMLHCDGCGADMPATVRFVARDAEYTPPVIYSKDIRAKLVWMAEAVPAPADAARLRPGQPVDVTLPVQP
ncbi:MAG: HlyD family efflux transporter periplasmic adaptor subunit [Burkholderiales bacterium]|nr:HlyD family efflux transporter periplasmic adaptor subunit [Burkholderiales bacterium]